MQLRKSLPYIEGVFIYVCCNQTEFWFLSDLFCRGLHDPENGIFKYQLNHSSFSNCKIFTSVEQESIDYGKFVDILLKADYKELQVAINKEGLFNSYEYKSGLIESFEKIMSDFAIDRVEIQKIIKIAQFKIFEATALGSEKKKEVDLNLRKKNIECFDLKIATVTRYKEYNYGYRDVKVFENDSWLIAVWNPVNKNKSKIEQHDDFYVPIRRNIRHQDNEPSISFLIDCIAHIQWQIAETINFRAILVQKKLYSNLNSDLNSNDKQNNMLKDSLAELADLGKSMSLIFESIGSLKKTEVSLPQKSRNNFISLNDLMEDYKFLQKNISGTLNLQKTAESRFQSRITKEAEENNKKFSTIVQRFSITATVFLISGKFLDALALPVWINTFGLLFFFITGIIISICLSAKN